MSSHVCVSHIFGSLSISGILSEKPADSLFTLDTTGSTAIQKAYNKIHKPLKADQILAQRSATPAVDSHKRPSGVNDGLIRPTAKKIHRDGVSRKDYERLKQVAYTAQGLDDILEKTEAPRHDLWHFQESEFYEDARLSYLQKPRPIQAPRTLKEAPISLVEGGEQVHSVPHPRPGTSYNPTFQDWDALLTVEGSKELDAEHSRLRQAQADEEQQARIAAVRQEIGREEGLQTEDESAWEGLESDVGKSEFLQKKRPERKTPQERRRAEKRKEKEREEKANKKARDRDKEEKRIVEIKKQLDRDMKKEGASDLSTNGGNDSAEVDDRILRRRRLGKDAIPEAPLELVLPDELQDSLRLLKPEGNLLKDRFRNILVRGKIESRKAIAQPKKKRRVLTEKWTHKDFHLGV